MAKFRKLFLIFIAVAGLTGCAAGDRTLSRKLVDGASYKLKSVRVVWVDNTALEISIESSGNYPATKQYIKEQTNIVNSLLGEFKKSAPNRLAERLASIGINDGNGTTIYMGAESASASLGRNVKMRVYIKDKLGKSVVWQVTIVRGGPTWGVTNNEVVDNFVNDTLHELRLAGWIS